MSPVYVAGGLARVETVNRMQVVMALVFLVDHKVTVHVSHTGTRYRLRVAPEQAGELRTAMGLYHAKRSGIH